MLSLDVRIVESAPLFFVRATLDGGAAREFAARFEAFRELRNLLARLTPAPLPDTSSISMIARCWRMPRDRSSSVA